MLAPRNGSIRNFISVLFYPCKEPSLSIQTGELKRNCMVLQGICGMHNVDMGLVMSGLRSSKTTCYLSILV